MSEVKTCEQYVLNRLAEMENRNAELESQVRELTIDKTHLEECLDKFVNAIKNHADIRRVQDSTSVYISFDSIWNNYDQEDFEVVKTVLNLELKEEEQQEEESEEEEDESGVSG